MHVLAALKRFTNSTSGVMRQAVRSATTGRGTGVLGGGVVCNQGFAFHEYTHDSFAGSQ